MKTIAIHGAGAAAACGGCAHDDGGARVCRVAPDPAGPAPELIGPADQLARVLAALASRTGCGPDGAGLVRRLHLRPGEADLQLSVPPHCGGVELADSAFQALRALLPDTDIYVALAR